MVTKSNIDEEIIEMAKNDFIETYKQEMIKETKQLNQQIIEECARLDFIIDLSASVIGHESYSDCFEEFLEDIPDYLTDKNKGFKEIYELWEDCDLPIEEVGEIFRKHNTTGYLVLASTQERKYCEDKTAFAYSWCSSYLKWFYGADLNKIKKEIITWVKETAEKDKNKNN